MRRRWRTSQWLLRTYDMNDEDGRAKATEGSSDCSKARAAASPVRWKVRLELPPTLGCHARLLHLQPSGKLHPLPARAFGARPASSLPA